MASLPSFAPKTGGILRLVGECRELGDDHDTWRLHLVERLAQLVDAEIGICGEMAACDGLQPRKLGVTTGGGENGFDRAGLARPGRGFPAEIRSAFGRPSRISAGCETMTGSACRGATSSRIATGIGPGLPDWDGDRRGPRPVLLPVAARRRGVLPLIEFFRAIGRARLPRRNDRARPRGPRRIAPLVGGPLARFAEPSPTGPCPPLPPGARLPAGGGRRQADRRPTGPERPHRQRIHEGDLPPLRHAEPPRTAGALGPARFGPPADLDRGLTTATLHNALIVRSRALDRTTRPHFDLPV